MISFAIRDLHWIRVTPRSVSWINVLRRTNHITESLPFVLKGNCTKKLFYVSPAPSHRCERFWHRPQGCLLIVFSFVGQFLASNLTFVLVLFKLEIIFSAFSLNGFRSCGHFSSDRPLDKQRKSWVSCISILKSKQSFKKNNGYSIHIHDTYILYSRD